MKNLLLSLVLFPVVSMAAPKVGDLAVYTGSMVVNGQSLPITVTRTIKSINADVVSIEEIFEGGGQSSSAMSEEKLDEMLTEESAQMILDNCAAFGGVNTPVIVAFGTFNSCKVTQEGAVAYFAAVPFGLAKVEGAQFENAVINLELKSATKGQ